MRGKLVRRIAATCLLALALGGAAALAQGLVFHGNAKSHVFHRPGCRFYDCGACTVTFPNREAAVQAGYRPCKVCNP